MQLIESESIKRVTNGDLIVRGNPEEILKSRYEDGWLVIENFRDAEEIQVERSGLLTGISTMINVKRRLSYYELVGNDWYILDAGLM